MDVALLLFLLNSISCDSQVRMFNIFIRAAKIGKLSVQHFFCKYIYTFFFQVRVVTKHISLN